MNPDLPLANVRTLETIFQRSIARTSFTLVMLAIAGGMALLIGIVGVYGVISYSVSQRTREIGIRMALGARPAVLTRTFVANGLMLAVLGAAIGLAASFSLMGVIKSLLFEVSPSDPLTYAVVSCGLIAAAALASFIPAMRASSGGSSKRSARRVASGLAYTGVMGTRVTLRQMGLAATGIAAASAQNQSKTRARVTCRNQARCGVTPLKPRSTVNHPNASPGRVTGHADSGYGYGGRTKAPQFSYQSLKQKCGSAARIRTKIHS